MGLEEIYSIYIYCNYIIYHSKSSNETTYLFARYSVQITLLRVIPTMTFIHFVTGKSSGFLSDISSGIRSGIRSGILPGISSGKSYGILSGISSRILSDILSGISSGILSGF